MMMNVAVKAKTTTLETGITMTEEDVVHEGAAQRVTQVTDSIESISIELI